MMLFKNSSALFLILRKAIVLLFFSLNPLYSYSQNLVPNPSFEEYDTCPNNLGRLENTKYWKTIMNTPDYFNSCSICCGASIPKNYFGFQQTETSTENGYVGLISRYGNSNPYKEIIGVNLIKQLTIGEEYFFSFQYSFGFHEQTGACCFSSRIGMKLLTNFIDTNLISQLIINNTSILYEDSVIADTSNWISFKGAFIADSEYTSLLIGNFYSLPNSQITCVDSSCFSYIYIDNICLTNLEGECNSFENKVCDDYKVYPNPTTGKINLESVCSNQKGGRYEIYNSIGQLILQDSISQNEQKLDFSFLPKGFYCLKINETIIKIILI